MAIMTSRVPAAVLLLTTILGTGSRAQQATPFVLDEATISGAHAAMRAGRLTCRGLVEQYLRRIAAYDKTGPAINAIIMTNPRALEEADDLDRRFKQSGPTGPLHCVPMIVKDNFETIGLQSANGSLALEGFVSPKDAFQVKRVKEAGALVLAKSNMAEWAFTPVRDGQLDPARLHEESVRARPCHRRLERRHCRLGRRQLRVDWPRQRHRQLDPRPVVAPGAGRAPLDDGPDQPRRGDAAQPAGRHRRTDWPHRGRRRRRVPGHRRRGSGRPGHGRRARAAA